MSYTAGGNAGSDYYGGAGNGNAGSDYYGGAQTSRDHIPMRSPSVGSLHRAPLAPEDTFRASMIGHPYAASASRPSARSNDSHEHGDLGVNGQGGFDPYAPYAQEDNRPMSNHAGYGTASAVRAQEAAPRNDWGAPAPAASRYQPQQQQQGYYTNENAYEQHGQEHVVDPFTSPEGGDELGGDAMSYYTNSHYHAPAPQRASQHAMTFGKRDDQDQVHGDDDYFDDDRHGPMKDDDSIVLGRASTSHQLGRDSYQNQNQRPYSRQYAQVSH